MTLGPSPSLTHASKLMRHGDKFLLYGGYDGKRWSDTIFEYSTSNDYLRAY
jgi:hypothetical protein